MLLSAVKTYGIIFVLSFASSTCRHSSGSHQASDNKTEITVDKVFGAIERLRKLSDMGDDNEFKKKLTSYQAIAWDNLAAKDKQRTLLIDLEMQKWGNNLSEFLATSKLIYSMKDSTFQINHEREFQAAIETVQNFRRQINQLISLHHPAWTSLHAEVLRKNFKGRGIRIAVFDVFEQERLRQQSEHYGAGHIEELQSFGKAVAMDHGNSVIDIIFAIAPEAQIVPVSADIASYKQAIRYISQREDIYLVNMSRAFLEKEKHLDGDFAKDFGKMLEQKIVCKSLGNTGTDLEGLVTKTRQDRNLGPVGNLFSYDLRLIKEFLDLNDKKLGQDHFLLALNLNLLGTEPALTASVPGSNKLAQNKTFSLAADGVFSWTTDNFEAGSSFAAPQLCAVLALLMEARFAHQKKIRPQDLSILIEATKANAKRLEIGAENAGLGLIFADATWENLQKY